MSVSFTNYGAPQTVTQIIADHTVVAEYTNIPQAYIDEVKKMWVVVAGESHSSGYRNGLVDLETANATYAVAVKDTGNPDTYTTSNLRFSRATWGDRTNSSGWIYDYGEEDWFTNSTAISRTKSWLSYCNSTGPSLYAAGFGWCWDPMAGDPSASTDPVTGNHWYGWCDSGPDGDICWGINDADNAISGNSVNMDTYLDTTQEYIDYCTTNSISTKVFFTTGPVDYDLGTGEEANYQAHLKYERIREYVAENSSRHLFDYADILCYNNSDELTTDSWNGNTFPSIASTNAAPVVSGDHISATGELRVAKAMWWFLARLAGWDGT